MKESATKAGFSTTTYKVRLYIKNIEYIRETQKLYNEAMLNYYNLLLENEELLQLSNQNCLSKLENLTIKDRYGKMPEGYIEQDIPAYLRRAAINQAIGYARSYVTKKEKNRNIGKAKSFNNSMVYYKGMYRNFTESSIEVKLFNGKEWKWFEAKIKGREIKEDSEILSPTIVLYKDYVMLHIPIKERIEDVTPVKERMKKENVRVCGISFSNSDSFAICTVLNEKGKLIKTKFIKGGDEYRNKTSKILAKIKKHRENGEKFGVANHKNYWKKLNEISNYYAHQVSKQIIDFCIENEVKVISIAKIEDINQYLGKKVGKYSPIYLRKKIIQYLSYKSFKNGIIITTVRSNYTASKCYICRSDIKRNGLKYTCRNGHKGDYFFNSSMNIGIMALKKFGKEIGIDN